MSYLISELHNSMSISHSVLVEDGDKQTRNMVVATMGLLKFYEIQESPEEELGFELLDSISFSGQIVALESIRLKDYNSEGVIVITETNVMTIVVYTDGSFVKVEELTFDGTGQQRSLDKEPLIIVDPSFLPEFFLVHLFQGVIQLCAFTEAIDFRKKSSKTKRLDSSLLQVKSVPIGNVVLHNMVISVASSSLFLTILYRDFNFNYSLRNYEININDLNLKQVEQLEEFDNPPSNIVSLEKGGVLVLSSMHLFYFPTPEVESLDVSDNVDFTSVSVNTKKRVITKSLEPSSNDLYLSFRACLVIDESRLLAISESGMTYLVHIVVLQSSKGSVVIDSFNFYELGYTTIPNDVHHVTKNMFFSSSRFSRSVLFRIQSEKPYISIQKFLPSSPPILDIDTFSESGHLDLLICQGGYYSGEFRKYKVSCIGLTLLKDLEITASSIYKVNDSDGFCKIRVNDNDNSSRAILLDSQSLDFKEEKDRLDDVLSVGEINSVPVELKVSGLQFDKQFITAEIVCGKILANSIVYMDSKNFIFIYDAQNLRHKFQVDSTSQVSNIEIELVNDVIILLMGFWDGSIQIMQISPSNEISRYKKVISEDVSVHSCALSSPSGCPSDCIWVHLTLSDGHVFQFLYDLSKEQEVKYKNVSGFFGGLPYRLTKVTDDLLIIFNEETVQGSQYDTCTQMFKTSMIMQENSVVDIIASSEDTVLVLLNGNLQIYRIDNIIDNALKDVVYSNSLRVKSLSIPRTCFSVVISVDLRPDRVTGEIERHSYLELIDDSSMSIIDTHKFEDDDAWDIVDLSPLNERENLYDDERSINPIFQGGFLALCNGRPDELILKFGIENSKFVRYNKLNYVGLSNMSSLTVQSLVPTFIEEFTYVVTGNINFMVKITSENGGECVIHSKSAVNLPTFTLHSVFDKNFMILGDLLKGLYATEFSMNRNIEIRLEKLNMEYEPNFLTSFDSVRASEEDEILGLMYGDSFGNLALITVEKKSRETTEAMAINLGDQINVIKALDRVAFNPKTNLSKPLAVVGTGNGGLYQVNQLLYDDDIEEVVFTCSKEINDFLNDLNNTESSEKSIIDNWKGFQKDGSGNFYTREQFGGIDLTQLKRWLIFDRFHSSNINSENYGLYLKSKTKLKACHKHKYVLQKLISEATLL